MDPDGGLVRLGGATLDLGAGTLTRNGVLLPLRSKSFRLLCELARHRGRVLSKEALLDAVWPDVVVTEDSLAQAIRDIRRVLGDDGTLLRTVARRGFLLTAEGAPPVPLPSPAGAARPRIAVLPLLDRTGAPDLGPVLDGLVEEATAGLARFRNLTVVARHSAFAAAAEGLGLAGLGERLHADFIVDGSARRLDTRLRLAFALNDARSGEVLWSDAFDTEAEGWLTLQDLLPRRIVQRLFTGIEDAGHQGALRRGSGNLSAFEHLARGRALFRSFEPGVNERARDHFAAAILADPTLGIAHSLLGLTMMSLHDYSLAPPEVKHAARAPGQQAVDLAPDDSRCVSHLAYFHGHLAEFEPAEQLSRRAVSLNPCDAEALYQLGSILLWRGRPEVCLRWSEAAREINPLWPAYYDSEVSAALYDLGRYDEAARTLLRLPRISARQQMRLAATYARMGDRPSAQARAALAFALAPRFDFVEAARIGWISEHDHQTRHLVDGIELALAMLAEG